MFRNFPTAYMFGDNGLGLVRRTVQGHRHDAQDGGAHAIATTVSASRRRKAVLAIATAVGLPFKIVEEIGYSPQTNDLSVEVAKAKAAKADLHMVIHRLNDIIIMVREMVKQRYEPMGIISPGSPGMQFPQFFKALGKYAELLRHQPAVARPQAGLGAPLPGPISTRPIPTILCGLEQGFMFEGLLVCVDAYRRAKSTEPEALVEALRTTHITNRVMLGGAITFDAKGQNTNLPFGLRRKSRRQAGRRPARGQCRGEAGLPDARRRL